MDKRKKFIFLTETGTKVPTQEAIDTISNMAPLVNFTMIAGPNLNDKKQFMDALKNHEIDQIVLSFVENGKPTMCLFDEEDNEEILEYIRDNYFQCNTSWELIKSFYDSFAE